MEVTRNTAYKVWIADLLNGNYVKGQEQFEAGYVEVKGNKISRVNILGGVVDKFIGENYVSVNLDDGSGILRLKSWNENTNLFLDVNLGDLILVVGKIKEYNNSIYVNPEIVKKLDNSLWFKVRKLELNKLYGEVIRIENTNFEEIPNDDGTTMNVVEEKVENVNSREVLISLIETLDRGEGADFNEVVAKSGFGDNAKMIVEELLRGGEVFELHKDKLRVTS